MPVGGGQLKAWANRTPRRGECPLRRDRNTSSIFKRPTPRALANHHHRWKRVPIWWSTHPFPKSNRFHRLAQDASEQWVIADYKTDRAPGGDGELEKNTAPGNRVLSCGSACPSTAYTSPFELWMIRSDTVLEVNVGTQTPATPRELFAGCTLLGLLFKESVEGLTCSRFPRKVARAVRTSGGPLRGPCNSRLEKMTLP